MPGSESARNVVYACYGQVGLARKHQRQLRPPRRQDALMQDA